MGDFCRVHVLKLLFDLFQLAFPQHFSEKLQVVFLFFFVFWCSHQESSTVAESVTGGRLRCEGMVGNAVRWLA